MAIRRLVRGEVSDDDVESVAREAATRQGLPFESVEQLEADNWLSSPCVVNDRLFVKIISEQNSLVHGLLTASRNLGVFSSGTEGFFEHFETPVSMAEHDLEATRKMRDIGVNAPEPLEAFEHEGYGVLVLEFLPDFETLGDLPPERVQQFVSGLFESLSRMHEAGLVHGDLRTENVLVVDESLYFIDATKVDADAIEAARAYDIACALAALEPIVGAATAVGAAAECYDADVLLEAESYFDFVNLRPDHDFSTPELRGEIEKRVSA